MTRDRDSSLAVISTGLGRSSGPDPDTGNGGDFSEALGSTFYPINLTHRSTNGNEVECSDSSYHSQGVNTALADGSVQFVRESIEITIWRAYGSINGREVTEGL